MSARNEQSFRAMLLVFAVALASLAALAWIASLGGTAQLARWIAHIEARVAEHRALALVLYAAACFATQLIVVPSGTLLVLAGGYLFGVPLAASILSVAAFLDGVVLFAAGRSAFSQVTGRLLSCYPRASRLVGALRSEGFVTVALLRLAPVVPNAIAALAASAAGVSWRSFVGASALTVWVRPLLVAVIGASLHSLADIARGVDTTLLRPLMLLALACALLLVIRVAVRLRT